jgi:hypothetical protein
MRETRKVARDAARGVVDVVATWVLVFVGVSMMLTALANRFSATDNSDAGWANRSNLSIRTDHLTGCDYLETRPGGITPRLRPDGSQVCKRP